MGVVNTYFSSVLKPGMCLLARNMNFKQNYDDVSCNSETAIICEIKLKLAYFCSGLAKVAETDSSLQISLPISPLALFNDNIISFEGLETAVPQNVLQII